MPVLNSGKDVVIEISESTVRDYILKKLRDSSTFFYSNPVGYVWPTDVELIQGKGLLIDLSVRTKKGKLTLPVPLDNYVDFNNIILPFLARLGVNAESLSTRVVDRDALAFGIDAYRHFYAKEFNKSQWQNFSTNFLSGIQIQYSFMRRTVTKYAHDCGVAISTDTIIRRINNALEFYVKDQPVPDFTFDEITASWVSAPTFDMPSGYPIRISGRAEAHRDGFDVDFNFVYAAKFVLDSEGINIDIREVSVDVDYWDGVQLALEYSVRYVIGIILPPTLVLAILIGPAIVDAYAKPIPIPGQRFLPRTFEIDDVFFQIDDLKQNSDGLRIFGRAGIVVPEAPRLKVNKGHAFILESPESFCANASIPVFQPAIFTLENEGDGWLWILSIVLDGDSGLYFEYQNSYRRSILLTGLRGTSWRATPNQNIPPRDSLQLKVVYLGTRNNDANGVIRITCNDPRLARFGYVKEMYVSVRNEGTPSPVVIPSTIELNVANTEKERRGTMVVDCKIVHKPEESSGKFKVFNDGNGPLFLCQRILDDPNGVFSVPFSKVGIPPIVGGSHFDFGYKIFNVYFYPTQVDTDYYATVTFVSNVGDITVQLHGRVEPQPEGMKKPWIPKELLVDLNGGSVCDPIPKPGFDLFKFRKLFEPIMDDDIIQILRLTFDHLSMETEITLNDTKRILQIKDLQRKPKRTFDIDYHGLPRKHDDGITRIVDFKAANKNQLALTHVSVSGRLIKPVKMFTALRKVVTVCSSKGFAYAGAQDGLHVIDWRVTNNPKHRRHIRMAKIRAMTFFSDVLFVVTEKEIVVFNTKQPEKITISARAKIYCKTTDIVADNRFIYLVDGNRLITFEFNGKHLSKRHNQIIPGGATKIGLFRGGIYLTGNNTLTLLSLEDPSHPQVLDVVTLPDIIENLSHYGKNIMISGKFGTYAYVVQHGSSLKKITEFSRKHWSIDFIVDREHKYLFKINTKGQIQLFEILPHRLDRKHFKKMLKLRYPILPSRKEIE